ncbi:MAG TPA: hypothetical protein VIP08_18340 [Phenylobacterium sp.]|uniref:hypothetical protein n=1 Tax=Phenylobacterium sp. TaxID=1871053 RepID=UPI002F95C24A
MSPLDHLPIPNRDLDGACAAFEALGFTVSPPCVYTSPEQPGAEWRNRSVFLAEGWFDLQHAPEAPASMAGAPASCLFRTGSLAASLAAFSEMRRTEPYTLIREWPGADLGSERFALFSVMERISPLVLAVIEHAYPCPDTRAEWFEHRNTARKVAGLIFRDAQPGPAAGAAASLLDISGFRYLDGEAFDAAFPGAKVAVRIEVASLDEVGQILSEARTPFTQAARSLRVGPPAPLVCGFEFLEA